MWERKKKGHKLLFMLHFLLPLIHILLFVCCLSKYQLASISIHCFLYLFIINTTILWFSYNKNFKSFKSKLMCNIFRIFLCNIYLQNKTNAKKNWSHIDNNNNHFHTYWKYLIWKKIPREYIIVWFMW